MPLNLSNAVRSVLNRLGIDVYRFPMPYDARRIRAMILKSLDINVVIDVGANVGQYGDELRRFGYHGKIVSFEPVGSTYDQLAKHATRDPGWECRRLALGASNGTTEINVSGTLSSLLPKAAGDEPLVFAFDRKEPIQVTTLDEIRSELYRPDDRVWLKLDVQGYEATVLRGAAAALPDIIAIEIELSLRPLYEGQALYREITSHLEANGYELWGLRPTLIHPRTGRLVEMDGIFCRSAPANP